MIVTPNKFALLIEDIVKTKRISYIDAVVLYCEKHNIDPSTTKSMINKNLKEKIVICYNIYLKVCYLLVI